MKSFEGVRTVQTLVVTTAELHFEGNANPHTRLRTISDNNHTTNA